MKIDEMPKPGPSPYGPPRIFLAAAGPRTGEVADGLPLTFAAAGPAETVTATIRERHGGPVGSVLPAVPGGAAGPS